MEGTDEEAKKKGMAKPIKGALIIIVLIIGSFGAYGVFYSFGKAPKVYHPFEDELSDGNMTVSFEWGSETYHLYIDLGPDATTSRANVTLHLKDVLISTSADHRGTAYFNIPREYVDNMEGEILVMVVEYRLGGKAVYFVDIPPMDNW